AFLLGLDPESKVLLLVSWAWAGFGAAFGPAIVLSLYWERMTRGGALAGILVGGVTVIIWPQLAGATGWQIFELYELVPGFVLSWLAVWLASRYEGRMA
ncbi:MAG TPA: sodium:proline symporter, partial [Gammaproteobacteria bacterium]